MMQGRGNWTEGGQHGCILRTEHPLNRRKSRAKQQPNLVFHCARRVKVIKRAGRHALRRANPCVFRKPEVLLPLRFHHIVALYIKTARTQRLKNAAVQAGLVRMGKVVQRLKGNGAVKRILAEVHFKVTAAD